MAQSQQIVVSDGTLALLTISISYLERGEIHVFFNDVENSLPWAWVGVTNKQISFTPAVPNGVKVTVKRVTDVTQIRHKYSAGAAFTTSSMDESFQQILHIAQEASEGQLGGDFFQDINMHGHKVTVLGDPTAAQDAVTKNWAETAMTSQLSQAISAKDSATASASTATTQATTATTQASIATTQATNASASATSASSSAASAASSATSALSSATSASASAAAAAASYDSFDDRYLGAKASAPATDNDGGALQVGAMYFSTAAAPNNGMRAWNGSAWEATYLPAADYALLGANNTFSGNNAFSGSNTHTGLATLRGGVVIDPPSDARIELGRVDGVANTPAIDFHSGAVAVDYDVRLTATGGTGSAGGGVLEVQSSNVKLHGTLALVPTGTASIEIGRVDGVASTPFIDFHSGAIATDFDARIIASGGNGVGAGATLDIHAAQVRFTGAVESTSTLRAWVTFNGLTGAVYAAHNVSSVTHNTAGDWTVNYSSLIPNGNVAGVSVTPKSNNAAYIFTGYLHPASYPTNTGVRVAVGVQSGASTSAADTDYVSVMVSVVS